MYWLHPYHICLETKLKLAALHFYFSFITVNWLTLFTVFQLPITFNSFLCFFKSISNVSLSIYFNHLSINISTYLVMCSHVGNCSFLVTVLKTYKFTIAIFCSDRWIELAEFINCFPCTMVTAGLQGFMHAGSTGMI